MCGGPREGAAVSEVNERGAIARTTKTSPRDPARHVFIGQKDGQFLGNAKHLFLHFATQRPEVPVHFLSRRRDVCKMLGEAGLPALFFPSDEAIQTLAAAGTIVVDTFDFRHAPYEPLVRDARLIQLWHGVGFKKIGFMERDSRVPGNYEAAELERLYSGYDTVITTSPFYANEVFAKAFQARCVAPLGYPRTDVLFRRPGKLDLLNADYDAFVSLVRLKKERRIILFAPTFRDKVGDAFGSGSLDYAVLDRFLDKAGMHLVIKGHHLTGGRLVSSLPNITVFDNNADVYPLMPLVDLMVTDYSSIFMDYLLLDRPVLFFCPDYDEYIKRNRELQFPYEAMTPGPKCRTQGELHEALAQVALGRDDYAKDRRALRDKAFLHTDGRASERIAAYLCDSSDPA